MDIAMKLKTTVSISVRVVEEYMRLLGIADQVTEFSEYVNV